MRRTTSIYGRPSADATLALLAFVTTILAGGAVLALMGWAALVLLFQCPIP